MEAGPSNTIERGRGEGQVEPNEYEYFTQVFSQWRLCAHMETQAWLPPAVSKILVPISSPHGCVHIIICPMDLASRIKLKQEITE